jgi:hypothetical protein
LFLFFSLASISSLLKRKNEMKMFATLSLH